MGFSRQEYWSGVPLPSLTHHDYVGFIPEMQGYFNIRKSTILVKQRWEKKKSQIDERKASDKFQHSFMIKILNDVSIEGANLNMTNPQPSNPSQATVKG